MTLVVCTVQNDEMLCLADTRLSQGTKTITDTGGKVFVIPVSTKKFDNNVHVESQYYTLGFAFCGSTLLANNTHAIASNCTQMIRVDSSSSFPSAESVANIYASSAEYVCRDFNSRQVSPTLFQGLVFGFCPLKKQYLLFSIEPEIEAGNFSVKSVELEMKNGAFVAIGSGRDEFIKQMKIPNSAGNPRTIIELFTQVMNEETVSDVGGFPQIAKALIDGVSIVPVLTQDDDNLDKAIMTINGFNISDIKLDEGCSIGYEAIGIGIERVTARSALKMRGIDPDENPVSKELQNLASFEMCLETAYKQSQQVEVDDNFSLSMVAPVSGDRYFYISCKKCKRNTPIFKAYSDGKGREIFTGTGKVTSTCINCGKKVNKKFTHLDSMIWN